jgi:hypothetical protein
MQCGVFRIDFGGLNRINLVFHDLEEKGEGGSAAQDRTSMFCVDSNSI